MKHPATRTATTIAVAGFALALFLAKKAAIEPAPGKPGAAPPPRLTTEKVSESEDKRQLLRLAAKHPESSETREAAKRHARRMRQLMRTNPRQAIEEALTFSEWLALPTPIQQIVERPFSAPADVEVEVECAADYTKTTVRTRLRGSSQTLETALYGERTDSCSKRSLPVQGISLDGFAVLRERTFQPLDAKELAAAESLFLTAVECTNQNAVAALSGGKVYWFRNPEAVERAEQFAQKIQSLPGEQVGAEQLEALAPDGDGEETLAESEELSRQWTGSRRDVYIILVDFSDTPGPPVDWASYSNMVNTSVSRQIQEMSYGKTYISAEVNPKTYRMSMISTNYDNTALWNEAVSNAEADVGVELDDPNTSPYETVCVFHKGGSGGYAGLATLGGRKMWLKDPGPATITHELGHNYGLSHASTWVPSTDNPADPAGEKVEYGDFTDIMGGGKLPDGHFNAMLKSHIDWLEPSQYAVVTNSGTIRLYRSDSAETTGTPRGLKIPKGTNEYYWVGLRQNYNDRYERFARGCYILWQQEGSVRHSYLLDMTPGSAEGSDDKYDSGLAMGQTYADLGAQVCITPLGHGGHGSNAWMDVAVELGEFDGNRPPVASIAGPDSVPARTSAVFRVSASDPDGDALAYYWQIGDGRVYPNAPSISVSWGVAGTATVACTVSDLHGGSTMVTCSTRVTDPLQTEAWQQLDSGQTNQPFYSIAIGNGKIVATGYNNVTSSEDGVTWSNVTSKLINSALYDTLFDGRAFVSVGKHYIWDPKGWVQTVWYSEDAVHWSRCYTATNVGTSLNALAFDGVSTYVAVGDDGIVMRSADATNWQTVATLTTNNLKDICFANGLFTAVGNNTDGIHAAEVWISSNGTDWTNRSDSIDISSWRHVTVIHPHRESLFAGGWYAGILRSDDRAETFASVGPSTHWEIKGFASEETILAGIGNDYDATPKASVFVSFDGSCWNRYAAPFDDPRSMAFYNGQFYIVGGNGNIWRSGTVQTDPNSGWGTWQKLHADELGAYRDEADDPDADGAPNWVEYATGTRPEDPDSIPEMHHRANDGFLELELPWAGRRPDIDYLSDETLNLESNDWSQAEVANETQTNIVFQTSRPVDQESRQFLRLKLRRKW